MNNIMKTVYVIIIIALLITLIYLFISLVRLMKKLAGVSDGINRINNNIEEINKKKEEIDKSKNSFKFFFTIYVVASVLKQTLANRKQGLAKSFAKTCIKNASKISKI